ncbi:zinc ABC transporter permease subunit ZnuB [Thioalkalivibrio sp.]|uniref:zinc ABC transporter permease subunit ZnuB n=1 Tax=Thioalkalivibrio sp. TaxID=2093813 RepID=UPI003566FF33
MLDDFVIRAVLAGLMVAVVAGPLGAFVVWRRMAYFGDTVSHSALLGVALGFLLGLNLNLLVTVVCVTVAVLLVFLQRRQELASDTLLGILAHSALSLGMVAVAFVEGLRVDLMAYLFGDILAVTRGDLAAIAIGGLLALVLLTILWRPLLAITVHEEIARVEGVPVLPVRLGLMLLIAVVIASAMQVVGVLLITALMIIPAATARRFARTPEEMGLLAAGFGVLAVLLGIWGSFSHDTPTGPSIVVAAMLVFVVLQFLPFSRSHHPQAPPPE